VAKDIQELIDDIPGTEAMPEKCLYVKIMVERVQKV
jgi:hypothetical protein